MMRKPLTIAFVAAFMVISVVPAEALHFCGKLGQFTRTDCVACDHRETEAQSASCCSRESQSARSACCAQMTPAPISGGHRFLVLKADGACCFQAVKRPFLPVADLSIAPFQFERAAPATAAQFDTTLPRDVANPFSPVSAEAHDPPGMGLPLYLSNCRLIC